MTDETHKHSATNNPRRAGPRCRKTGNADGESLAPDAEAPVFVGDAGQPILVIGEIGRGENTPLELAWKLAEPGDIYLRSAGGSFHDGLAMAQQVKTAQRTVYAPYCGSAAVLILTAGKFRTMPSNGWILVHSGWFLFAGPAALIRPQLEYQERIDAAYHEWLVTHTNAGAEIVRDWMAGETYLTADEALHFGLIDDIGPAETVPAPQRDSVEMAALKNQRRICAEVAAQPPRRPTDEQLDAMALALTQHRAPAFDALIDGGKPDRWPLSSSFAAAAADCHNWTRAAIIRHEDQGRPLPEHPWPARWACPECGEWNYHPPHRVDGNPAACVFCEPPTLED